MPLWEEFEEYLYERHLLAEDFNQAAVAEDLDVPGWEATRYIQSYLDAQVRKDSKTLFVLHRLPGTRTKNAMWHVGDRAVDARSLGSEWVSDVMRRIERFTEPTLKRIGEKNPRAVPAARAIAKSIEASLELMVSLMDAEA